MVPDMGYILTDHRPATIPTVIETVFSGGTLHTPHISTAAACTDLWPVDAPITICTMTTTGIVTPHPAFSPSPADITHATPQTAADLTPATPTVMYRKHSKEKSSNVKDPQTQ